MNRRKRLVGLVLAVGLLTGCGREKPVVEITTSNGDAIVATGTLTQETAKNIYALKLNSESADVHFFCSDCGYDEVMEMTAPAAKMFKCECKSEPGYACVLIGDAKLPEE